MANNLGPNYNEDTLTFTSNMTITVGSLLLSHMEINWYYFCNIKYF